MAALCFTPSLSKASLHRSSFVHVYTFSSTSGRNAFHHQSSVSFSSSGRYPSLFSMRCCSSNQDPGNSSSNAAGAWDDDDCNYLEATVVDAVSLFPSQGHLFMSMLYGGEVQVDHVNPTRRPLLFSSPNPSIFLKILSETDLYLPMLVRDSAIDMLMSALHGNEKTARPNQYQIMRDLVQNLEFEVRMVRITDRVNGTYIARIFIGKPGHAEMRSIDARPSDAVNLAVRCKVPIYVHKDIVASDAVKPVVAPLLEVSASSSSTDVNLDIPDGEDYLSEEITLAKNMVLAIEEERYSDAAHWRDELKKFQKNR
ncbi:hypothetical protein KP509_22G026600 [Ceratopteris richardii]|uniref:BFN domain-containing protein n=1 Tax=Ceratopteris richardii TaxID=49495 RepID=A0A8T2S6S0_CERRI|nr:hypothetical protein KP509_22G026600 [Ceratopteris richardii]